MPIHDWTRVEAGIFHHFHHGWIEEIARALNRGILPEDYYALAEQRAGGLVPDVLTLQASDDDGSGIGFGRPSGDPEGGLQIAPPPVRLADEADLEFYRRKQARVSVRHTSDDGVVAVVEIISPDNKSTSRALRSFIDKTAELLERDVHLLILDLFPPGPRDPRGIHAAIWDEIAGREAAAPPADRPLTLAAYEANLAIRAYVEHAAVGAPLPDMPLFLRPDRYVSVPLDATYGSAWEAVPRRWRRVLEAR